MKNNALKSVAEPAFIWKDRKRILGMPLSFTKYRLSADRIFCDVGLLTTKCDELLLYRVIDISMSIGFFQRLTGVGTITINSSDSSTPKLLLKNVRKPRSVKELIHRQVETAKLENRVRISEYMGVDHCGHGVDSDGDGIPDVFDND